MLRALLVAAALLLVAAPAAPEDEPERTLGPGDRLAPFALEDQHGETRRVDATTGIVLFSRDMDGGDVLESALEGVSADALAERDAVYVADISGMPGLVARLFAIPSLRGRPYPILLDRDGETTARLPDEDGAATLLFLDALEVQRVEHLRDPDAVRGALGIEGVPGT